jgi:hypothetical protein
MACMRWLYHALPRHEATAVLAGQGPLVPSSLATEGFVHTSYRDVARASAELYVGGDAVVLAIDPRRLGLRVEIAETPRGPMPHVMGPVPRGAIHGALELSELASADDHVKGTRFGFVAFEGMTLLDLVGALDPISRLATMGFDPTSTCEVVAGTPRAVVWSGSAASLSVTRVRPDLTDFDVLVVPGGPGARALADDAGFLAWLGTVEVHHEVADVGVGRRAPGRGCWPHVAHDAVDVAQHARHVAVHVDDAVRAGAGPSSRLGKLTAPVVAP